MELLDNGGQAAEASEVSLRAGEICEIVGDELGLSFGIWVLESRVRTRGRIVLGDMQAVLCGGCPVFGEFGKQKQGAEHRQAQFREFQEIVPSDHRETF